jgi:hypothetical protein
VSLVGLVPSREVYTTPPPPPVVIQVASSTVDVWIYRLGDCESRNNELAINPMDLDGTPSKGQYQFKDGTFNHFSKKYNIPVTSIWEGSEQEQIVRHMIEDEEVNLAHEFPDCVKKLGLPSAQ